MTKYIHLNQKHITTRYNRTTIFEISNKTHNLKYAIFEQNIIFSNSEQPIPNRKRKSITTHHQQLARFFISPNLTRFSKFKNAKYLLKNLKSREKSHF